MFGGRVGGWVLVGGVNVCWWMGVGGWVLVEWVGGDGGRLVVAEGEQKLAWFRKAKSLWLMEMVDWLGGQE